MGIKVTTGGFTSSVLLEEEMRLTLPSLTITDALEIGEIAKQLGEGRALPIAVEVRLDDWVIYHASLPGSTSENQWWKIVKREL